MKKYYIVKYLEEEIELGTRFLTIYGTFRDRSWCKYPMKFDEQQAMVLVKLLSTYTKGVTYIESDEDNPFRDSYL